MPRRAKKCQEPAKFLALANDRNHDAVSCLFLPFYHHPFYYLSRYLGTLLQESHSLTHLVLLVSNGLGQPFKQPFPLFPFSPLL